MKQYKTLSKHYSTVFSVAKLHQKYWKEFCDVCYSRFGFETDENKNYEQKYETFCRCKGVITDKKKYEEELLAVTEEDLKQLKTLENYFFVQKNDSVLIPYLFLFVKKMWIIMSMFRNDMKLIPYICPRCSNVDYTKYLLDESNRISSHILNCKNIRDTLKDSICKAMLEEMLGDSFDYYTEDFIHQEIWEDGPFEYNKADGKITELVNLILDDQIIYFNQRLKELIAVLPTNNDCPKGNELKAFLYRLFISYEDSLVEIKEMLDELPFPLNIFELQEERDQQISQFESTEIGKHWIKCMEYEDGIKNFSRYFMHHRNLLTSEKEHDFFYLLDKICIIEDILKGNAHKYRIEVEYPEGWLSGSEIISPNNLQPCPFINTASMAGTIIAKIREYQSGKTKPKDVSMPIRAAIDAGVIRRPTYEEYCCIKTFANIPKSSFSEYTNPDKTPYYGEAYEAIVDYFKTLK